MRYLRPSKNPRSMWSSFWPPPNPTKSSRPSCRVANVMTSRKSTTRTSARSSSGSLKKKGSPTTSLPSLRSLIWPTEACATHCPFWIRPWPMEETSSASRTFWMCLASPPPPRNAACWNTWLPEMLETSWPYAMNSFLPASTSSVLHRPCSTSPKTVWCISN